MASYWTTKGLYELAEGGTTGRTFRIMLVNAAPASAAAAANLNTVSQVTADELSGTGYARKTLTSVAVTEDDTNDRAVFDAADPSVYSSMNAGTIAGAWVYRRVGGSDVDGTDLLWCFLDCTDLTTNGGDVTLAFAAAGISTLA